MFENKTFSFVKHFKLFLIISAILVVTGVAGLVTLPFGLNLFVTSSISGEQPMTIGKSAIPYIGVFVIALFIIAFVPQFSMLLVK